MMFVAEATNNMKMFIEMQAQRQDQKKFYNSWA